MTERMKEIRALLEGIDADRWYDLPDLVEITGDQPDSHFIFEAPQAIRDLLARVDELEAENKKLTQGKVIRYEIDSPGDYEACIGGFCDTITVIVESGEPGGEDGEFAKDLQEYLRDWYDGASVENMADLIKCPVCNGSRENEKSDGPCVRCGGEGTILKGADDES